MNPPEPEIEQAGMLVKQLIKTVKTCALYPDNNPVYRQGLDALMSAFSDFLELGEELQIKVEKYRLLFKDTAIYEEEPSDDNFAFTFFNDGIQWMIFKTGLTQSELEDLVSIISDARIYGLERFDIVTSIWEEKFPNIHFIASDEGLFQEYEEIPMDYKAVKEHIVRYEPAGRRAREAEGKDAPGGPDTEKREEKRAGGGGLAAYEETGPHKDEDSIPLVTDKTRARLSGVEKDYLDHLIEKERLRDVNAIMTELVIETTWNETDKSHCPRLIGILEEQFQECFSLAKADLLKSILRDLDKMRAACSKTHPWKATLLDEASARLGNEKFLTKLDLHVSKFEPDQLREVLLTLATMRRGNITSLCRTLGRTENRTYRRILCDTLVELGPEALAEMIPFLQDQRWFLVRNILFILGRIGGEEAQQTIKSKLSHSDRRVRREAVNALLQDEPVDVGSLLDLLEDEDKTIRLTILSTLFNSNKPKQVCEALKGRIGHKDFSKKEQDEINLTFEALGDNGDPDLISFLKPLLIKRRLFRRARHDKLRLGAALALNRLGTEEARALLLTGDRKGPASARRACREVLSKS